MDSDLLRLNWRVAQVEAPNRAITWEKLVAWSRRTTAAQPQEIPPGLLSESGLSLLTLQIDLLKKKRCSIGTHNTTHTCLSYHQIVIWIWIWIWILSILDRRDGGGDCSPKGTPPKKKNVFFRALPELPLPLFRATFTSFSDVKNDVAMVAIIIMMVILMIMMTKITKKQTNIKSFG